MPASFGEKYQFGDFELDTTELVLRKQQEIVSLTPKALQVLIILVRNGGRVVSRKQLLETLWADAFVEDSNLTVAISALRKALGDNSNGDRFIETVAKRGYRFVPSVKFVSNVLPPKDRFGAMQIARLTHDGHIMDVGISKDGRLMAYVPITSGKQALHIQDLETGERRQLLAPDAALCWGIKFTHDRRSLFYITTQPSSTISVLYRMSLLGGQATKLVVNIDSPIALSPDETQMAFVRSFPGQHRDAVIVSKIDGSGEREIATRYHPEKFSFTSPTWSPDGKLITLGASRYNAMEYAIVGVPANGEPLVELSPWDWRVLCALAWSDDGSNLYFSAQALKSNSFQIWRLPYPNGQAQRVTNDPNNYEELSLAERPRAMVTMQTEVRANLWLASSADARENGRSASARRITSGRTEGFAGLSAAAGRIVFASTEHQQPDLWSVNLEGQERERLTDTTGFLPSVSPDGNSIAYVSSETGTHHIWFMDGGGKYKRQLTDGGGESFPSLTSDGKWVIYTSLSRARNSLWKVSTGGGEPKQLTSNCLCIKPVVSRDAAKVACAYRTDEADNWKIAVLSLESAETLAVFPLPNPYNQLLRWTADDNALTFLERREGVHNVWKQPLTGGEATQLTYFTEDLIYAYDWLPQGDGRLVAARGIKTRDIVLIRDFD
ncbi:MAG TPA: winged helix-turn-helix domain-containing protein [Pyrinomonadaceae bacterium]|nr:winged helix-turn-helix domain-containing protein [Pyrinomonadaceae bacterium]